MLTEIELNTEIEYYREKILQIAEEKCKCTPIDIPCKVHILAYAFIDIIELNKHLPLSIENMKQWENTLRNTILSSKFMSWQI